MKIIITAPFFFKGELVEPNKKRTPVDVDDQFARELISAGKATLPPATGKQADAQGDGADQGQGE